MTRPPSPPVSQNYRHVLQGYLRLHQLTVEGRDESPEADAVRDSLDRPWRLLTDAEREQVQGLSVDLFEIDNPIEGAHLEMSPDAQHHLAEAVEARQRGEWDRALAQLRTLKKHLTPAILSKLRAEIWSEAGHPDVGAVFLEHAGK